ncbi:MAG TPA: glycerophosphodiester phosphodiesterase family protein [Blastocatellia bacterium]|nr:glycerophosphodiester phosphodiesterase family protein [Blastocatellia bacterium]
MASSRNKPLNVAHRGASAYAPEHTLASYMLAVQQGADFVELDLQVTKDGALVCLHDAELSRTTNVAEIFPDRTTMRDPARGGNPKRGWYVIDFTLAEIKRLDAGSWFNRANPFAAKPAYAKERIPTLREAIKAVGNRAGLYIEMKYWPFYKSLGHDMATTLSKTLNDNGYGELGRRGRVLIQSFHKSSLLRLREIAPHYTRIQLLPMEDSGREQDTRAVTPELVREIVEYANGVGPSKTMISGPEQVAIFHAAGLLVHPYTFRGSTTSVLRQPLNKQQADGTTLRQNIVAEIQRYIGYGVDGGFTDYPDLWKEALREPINPR